jgi:hypothetical protein
MKSFITSTLHPNIITVVKSRRMRWAKRVAHMGEMRNSCILVGEPERDHAEDLGVDVKITLYWILGNYGLKVWTGCIWLRKGTGGRPL